MSALASLEFSDLLIEEQGFFLKNLTGAKQILTPVDKELEPEVQNIFKKLEENHNDRKEFALVHDQIRYRVSRTQTVNGFLYVLRKGKTFVPTLQELGVPPYVAEKLLSKDRKSGLVLISGKMSSGKTTTACALIKAWLEKYGGHAIAIEDPPELPLQEQCTDNGRCYQVDISGKSMSKEIVSTLRRAADLIFLGELRDEEAVSEALRASINGHLILATIHAPDIKETLQKLITMGSKVDGTAAHKTLAQGFEAVVHQDFNPTHKRLSVKFLFAEGYNTTDASGIRGKIREDRIHNLEDDINLQHNQMLTKSAVLKKRRAG